MTEVRRKPTFYAANSLCLHQGCLLSLLCVSVILDSQTTTQTFIKSSFVFVCFSFLTLFLFLLSSASIPFFACELKAVTPYERGFFCGDDSITYPYLEREAIPDTLLIAGGIAITGLTVRPTIHKFLMFFSRSCPA